MKVTKENEHLYSVEFNDEELKIVCTLAENGKRSVAEFVCACVFDSLRKRIVSYYES